MADNNLPTESQFGKQSVKLFNTLSTVAQHPQIMLVELCTLLYFLYSNLSTHEDQLDHIRTGIGIGILSIIIFYIIIRKLNNEFTINKVHYMAQYLTIIGTTFLLFLYGIHTFIGVSSQDGTTYGLIEYLMPIPPWFIVYFLITNKKITTAHQNESLLLLQKLVKNKQAVAIYPTKSKVGIDYQLVNKLPRQKIDAKQENKDALNTYISFEQIPFLIIKQGTGKTDGKVIYKLPSTFSIGQLKGTSKRHDVNHSEVKLVSLSNIFIMTLFSNFNNQSLIWSRINPNYLLNHPSSSNLPFSPLKEGIIEYRWLAKDLQNVANNIRVTIRTVELGDGNPIFSSFNHAKKILRNNPLESKRIDVFLKLLSHKHPEENEHYWLSMLNGFCIGNETRLSGNYLRKENLIYRGIKQNVAEKLTEEQNSELIRGLSQDDISKICEITYEEAEKPYNEILQICIEMERINEAAELTQTEINRVMESPVEEFIKVHDQMISLLNTSSDKFMRPEDMNTYIDSMVKQMLSALHSTMYIERQVFSGSISSGKLVEERKGIIAGFTLSAKTTLEALSLVK
jgi:hypothetical protein